MVLSRREGRLLSITETYNAPGNPLDAESAIADLRRHFNISGDLQRCMAKAEHRGICEVQDAALPDEVNYAATFQYLTTMRIVSLRRHPLKI